MRRDPVAFFAFAVLLACVADCTVHHPGAATQDKPPAPDMIRMMGAMSNWLGRLHSVLVENPNSPAGTDVTPTQQPSPTTSPTQPSPTTTPEPRMRKVRLHTDGSRSGGIRYVLDDSDAGKWVDLIASDRLTISDFTAGVIIAASGSYLTFSQPSGHIASCTSGRGQWGTACCGN